jgi:sugar phosphate isomerase/epimerase
VFVAASTKCFSDKSFEDACFQLADLEYDKVELWLDESSEHLKPSVLAQDPEGFYARYRDITRLTPVALCLEHDVDAAIFAALSKLAKLMRVTQITIPASPLGTPFNAEIDRLREFVGIASEDGIRVSIKTMTGHLTEDAHTAVELCQAVRGLGLTLDPSFYICGPQSGKSYDQVYPYVFHVHLRDTTPEQVQVQVGLGEVDYSRLITHLRRYDYNRALSADLFVDKLKIDDRPLELRKLRMLLESLL